MIDKQCFINMTKLDDQNVAQTKENLSKLKTHCEIVIALCDQNLTDAKEKNILKEEYEHIAVKTDYIFHFSSNKRGLMCWIKCWKPHIQILR